MIKSIFGGIAIAIGAYINLQHNGIIGALFFSIGLYLICNFNLNLYTGKVGYTGIIKNLPILFGNFLGCLIMFCYPTEQAQIIVTNKLAIPLYLSFLNAIICGILIYAAVDCFKKNKEYMILLCVPAFILFGAEHCIADICYIISAQIFTLESLIFIIVVILGNSIGSIAFNYIVSDKGV